MFLRTSRSTQVALARDIKLLLVLIIIYWLICHLEIVGADLGVMDRDARKMREGGPTIFAQVKNGKGVDAIVDMILSAWRSCGAAAASK